MMISFLSTGVSEMTNNKDRHMIILDGKPHFVMLPKFELRCDHCLKSFTSRAILQKHISTYHAFVYSGELKCLFCNFECDKQEDMSTHNEDSHKYICRACNKSFSSASGYHNHKKLHHGSRDNLYTCKICGTSYGSSSRLKIHEASHSTKKLFQCDICKKKYKYKHGLDYHIRSYH
jgi:KRAB domain-containing zinc finger protein